VACEAAQRAGRLQVEHYERLETIEHKGARDVVTEVDRACEALILEEIRAAFPRDAILAEESGAHRGLAEESGAHRGLAAATGGGGAARVDADPIEIEQANEADASHPGGSRSGPDATLPAARAPDESTSGSDEAVDPTGGARRAWIVDPLDGTINYANGIPVFCVCIGLAVAGHMVMGVVYDPIRDELFAASRGRGATLNGRRITLPDKPELGDYVVSLGMRAQGNTRRRRRIGRAIRAMRNMGSAGLSLTYVANGRFDAFIQVGGLSNWDIAGPGIIAQEAGAVLTGVAGEPWFDLRRATRTVSIVAASPRYHAKLLDYLR
jgi:myo-inositol-1(or 4)-monophosphatase